ncbi:hypothetical protein HNQ56_000564 [Anaerotaenia torta]
MACSLSLEKCGEGVDVNLDRIAAMGYNIGKERYRLIYKERTGREYFGL